MSICGATSAAAAATWIFALCNGSETLRHPRSTAKSEITVSRPRHQNGTIAASLWAQPGRHVMAAVDQGQAHAPPIPLAGSAILLLFGVTLRPQLRCDPCQCGQADMWDARAIVTRDEAFLSLVVEPQERSQDFASWKFSASTVAGLQISWAVVKRWRAREGRGQESPERQGRAKRWSSMPWKRVISSWPAGQRRIHKAANQMGRLYHWLQS